MWVIFWFFTKNIFLFLQIYFVKESVDFKIKNGKKKLRINCQHFGNYGNENLEVNSNGGRW